MLYDDLNEYGEPKKKPIKPMMYTDIDTDHEYSSANTAHKKCEKALMKLKEAIKDLIQRKKSPVRNAEKSAFPTGKVIGLFCDFSLFINNEQSNH